MPAAQEQGASHSIAAWWRVRRREPWQKESLSSSPREPGSPSASCSGARLKPLRQRRSVELDDPPDPPGAGDLAERGGLVHRVLVHPKEPGDFLDGQDLGNRARGRHRHGVRSAPRRVLSRNDRRRRAPGRYRDAGKRRICTRPAPALLGRAVVALAMTALKLVVELPFGDADGSDHTPPRCVLVGTEGHARLTTPPRVGGQSCAKPSVSRSGSSRFGTFSGSRSGSVAAACRCARASDSFLPSVPASAGSRRLCKAQPSFRLPTVLGRSLVETTSRRTTARTDLYPPPRCRSTMEVAR